MSGVSEVVVILDRPTQPGNIGAVARAMKNMGLSRLRLVAPAQFPHPEAVAFASGAQDLLAGAEVFESVTQAIADIHWLVATSTRNRGQRQRIVTPRELAGLMLDRPAGQRIGWLFGTERTGLETRDLERADLICHIPTAAAYTSLNLAQAVLLLAYEWMLAEGRESSMARDPLQEGVADKGEMERLFLHMEESLRAIDFLKEGQDRHMMGSLRALFHRAGLDRREVAILRGVFHEMTSSRRRASGGE
ncbi:MAG: RNA methyltransferase [Magnetococcales bacterium]|nr:RNA methyltransferase [Magnetococcales bacterium]